MVSYKITEEGDSGATALSGVGNSAEGELLIAYSHFEHIIVSSIFQQLFRIPHPAKLKNP